MTHADGECEKVFTPDSHEPDDTIEAWRERIRGGHLAPGHWRAICCVCDRLFTERTYLDAIRRSARCVRCELMLERRRR